ncbi:GTPase activating rab protein [Mycena chlorophos]|uniref:GTPase activating rab protein n=1 Tax=Mycena chlorophos TaxID=658473 RepID=A0A8H6T054_MYCCL|nr:GTPase activating rab protein [Mycena chlorophos]
MQPPSSAAAALGIASPPTTPTKKTHNNEKENFVQRDGPALNATPGKESATPDKIAATPTRLRVLRDSSINAAIPPQLGQTELPVSDDDCETKSTTNPNLASQNSKTPHTKHASTDSIFAFSVSTTTREDSALPVPQISEHYFVDFPNTSPQSQPQQHAPITNPPDPHRQPLDPAVALQAMTDAPSLMHLRRFPVEVVKADDWTALHTVHGAHGLHSLGIRHKHLVAANALVKLRANPSDPAFAIILQALVSPQIEQFLVVDVLGHCTLTPWAHPTATGLWNTYIGALSLFPESQHRRIYDYLAEHAWEAVLDAREQTVRPWLSNSAPSTEQSLRQIIDVGNVTATKSRARIRGWSQSCESDRRVFVSAPTALGTVEEPIDVDQMASPPSTTTTTTTNPTPPAVHKTIKLTDAWPALPLPLHSVYIPQSRMKRARQHQLEKQDEARCKLLLPPIGYLMRLANAEAGARLGVDSSREALRKL